MIDDLASWLGLPAALPDVPTAVGWLPRNAARIRRLLLLSDIHANWHALVRVLEAARGQYDATWFLGDLVGYGPRALECVEFGRQALARNGRWRAGNHDLGVAELPCATPEGFRPSRIAQWTWQAHRQALLDVPECWAWFERTMTCERAVAVTRRYGNSRLRIVHANPFDLVGRYLYPDDQYNIADHLKQLSKSAGEDMGTICLLTGHTHMVCLAQFQNGAGLRLLPVRYGEPIPLLRGRYFINPGSVGQPRDGDSRAAYAILDVTTPAIIFHRVEYDVKAAQCEMQALRYPDELIARLDNARVGETMRYEKVYQREGDGTAVVPIEHS